MLPVDRFAAYVQQNQLFTSDMPVLAAVSGGMDSVLLAHLLKESGNTFGIAHCNFQLRGAEADAEQQFCHMLARQLDVPFYTVNFETKAYATGNKISIQMAARELRYRWFEEVRLTHGYEAVALAHHQNDTIETILLNLTRGTGIAGLHGILPRNSRLVRPLLFMSRDEIAAIVESDQLAYMEDSSNASTKYARNKLRHEVVPKLKELNPNLEATFARNLLHFKELEQLLKKQVAKTREKICREKDGEVHLSIEAIKALEPRRLLLTELLKDHGFNETMVDDLLSSLGKHSGRQFASGTHTLILDRDHIILSPLRVDNAPALLINEGDKTVNWGGHQINITFAEAGTPIIPHGNKAYVDVEMLVYPLTIRSWQQGDTFVPLGMKGTKKLSDLFIGLKIPVHQKANIPIMVNGNNEVIWVAGHRMDDRYKITDRTKKVAIFDINIDA
jgi:tRNA(Ile)-lysidine synthase